MKKKKKEELGCQALPNHAARLGSVFKNVLVRLCSLWLWEERPVLAVPCGEEGEMPFGGCVSAVGRDAEQLLGLSGMAEGKMPPGMIRARRSGLWLQHSLAGMAPGRSWP